MFVGHWLGKNLSEEKIVQFKHFFIGGGLIAMAAFIGWILLRRRHRPVTDQVVKKLASGQLPAIYKEITPAENTPVANTTVDAPQNDA